MAAHYLYNCMDVLDIGCYKLPITMFLRGQHERVWCIDPLLDQQPEVVEKSICVGTRLVVVHARFIRKKCEEVDLSSFQTNFGLVALGVDVGVDVDRLAQLIRRASVTVLEAPSRYAPGLQAVQRARELSGRSEAFRIKLDLSASGVPRHISDSFPTYYERELVVIR